MIPLTITWVSRQQTFITSYTIPISHYSFHNSFHASFHNHKFSYLRQYAWQMRYLTIYYPYQDMVLTKICVLWRHPQFIWILFRVWCVVLHTNILDIPIITVHVLLSLIRSFVVWSNARHSRCYTTSTWLYDWPHFERVVPYYIVTYEVIVRALKIHYVTLYVVENY